MSFFAKRYKQCVRITFKSVKTWMWLLVIFIGAIGFEDILPRRLRFTRFVIGAAIGALLMAVSLLTAAIFSARKDINLYKVLDKYGFSVEYLRAYEQYRIVGKPFRLQYAAEYAEIFINIGQPQDALNYLNAVAIPPNAPIQELVGFFFVYVIAALKTNNVPLAEEIWRRYEGTLMQAKSSPYYRSISVLTILPLIYIDCFAGRVQRAYEQTVVFINSKDYQNSLSPTIDVDIVYLYELVALGRVEEAAALRNSLAVKLQNYEPPFAALKGKIVADFNKACQGEIPI